MNLLLCIPEPPRHLTAQLDDVETQQYGHLLEAQELSVSNPPIQKLKKNKNKKKQTIILINIISRRV